MPRLLLGLTALCLLAACDSNEPSIALDGVWVSRDSVFVFSPGGTMNVRGTREQRYTFATRGTQISGTALKTTRDRQETVLSQIELPLTGEILNNTRFTITEGEPSYEFTYNGTATAAELRLVPEGREPSTPLTVVLRRP